MIKKIPNKWQPILLIVGAILLPFMLTALYLTVVINTNIGAFTLEYNIDRIASYLITALGALCLWKLIKNRKVQIIATVGYALIMLRMTAFFAWGFSCNILHFNCM